MSEIIDEHNSALNVFAAPSRDISIDSYQFVEILEKSNTSELSNALNYYEVLLNDKNSWLNLSDAYLELRGVLQTTSNTNIIEGSVAPINNIQNIFRRAECWIEGKSVQVVEYPGTVSHVTDLVKNSPDYEKSGSMELYHPDIGNGGISVIKGFLTTRVTDDVTNPAAPVVTFSTISGTGANPHVIGGGVGVDDAKIDLFVGNERIHARLSTQSSDGPELQLLKNGANADDPIDYAGIVNGDIVYLYDDRGRRVTLQAPTGDAITQLVANAGLNLTFANGNGTAVAANTLKAVVNSYADKIYPVDGNDNPSFTKRMVKFLDANSVYLTPTSTPAVFYVPIRKIFSFWDHTRHVWKGASMRFRFDRDTSNEYIFRTSLISDSVTPTVGASTLDCYFRLQYLSMWLPVVQPNLLINAQLNKQIADQASTLLSFYDYEYFENERAVNAGTTAEQIWKVTSKTERIVRAFMFMQRSDARTSQAVNKGVFGGFDIESAQCSVNGVIYPRTKYQIDKTGNYTRFYNEFLRAGGHIATPSTGACISYEEWADLYQIIVFDLSYQPDGDKVYTGKNSPSDLEVRVKLRTGYPHEWKMYVILQTERWGRLEGTSDMLKLL